MGALDPAFGIRDQLDAAGIPFPEKVEGLAFGPDLEDGRHLLWVTVDNDFFSDRQSVVWAFAIGGDDFEFLAQAVPEPKTAALFAFGALLLAGMLRHKPRHRDA